MDGHSVFELPIGVTNIMLLAYVACETVHYFCEITFKDYCLKFGTFVVRYISSYIYSGASFAVGLITLPVLRH